jgi:cation diffusion facilitator CzcD-associated flavoprotein CzcO
VDEDRPAAEVVSGYYGRFERKFDLRVRRPVRVNAVRPGPDQRLLLETSAGTWSARALVNASGTWTKPFWPSYPGAATFKGRQLHTADYQRPQEFAGRHVVVVGGGNSAVQLLAEISTWTTTTWVTRREPVWHEGPFDESAGREAVAQVQEAVRGGRPPASVVSVTGLGMTPAVKLARDRGVLVRRPMFSRITPTGVSWDNGDFTAADVILWCTGFRAALDHLAPLHLREPGGGVRVDGSRVLADPRIHLIGYGPSASTIGANRAARVAARQLRQLLTG